MIEIDEMVGRKVFKIGRQTNVQRENKLYPSFYNVTDLRKGFIEPQHKVCYIIRYVLNTKLLCYVPYVTKARKESI